jgi:hypothetical protein
LGVCLETDSKLGELVRQLRLVIDSTTDALGSKIDYVDARVDHAARSLFDRMDALELRIDQVVQSLGRVLKGREELQFLDGAEFEPSRDATPTVAPTRGK